MDHRLHAATVERMASLVEPDWTVREDVPVASGRHALHRLRVDAPDGPREVVLKATTDDRDYCVEARLLAVLGAETDLPVPAVVGAVDDHDDVPTPFFVMEALPGESVHKTELDALPRERLREVAVSSGTLLAALHDLDAVDAYGPVAVERSEPLSGGVPSGSTSRLSVPDGDRSWPAHVERSIEALLDDLAGSRFADVVPEVRSAVDPLVAPLRAGGPFEPVVGRVEHSPDNLLIDDGRVTGLLDWEFVAGTTAANDLVLAEFWLAGGPWALVPSTPSYRPLVRSGLREGYRDAGSDRVLEDLRAHREPYETLVGLRTMALFDDLFDAVGATAEQRAGAAATLRERVVGPASDPG